MQLICLSLKHTPGKLILILFFLCLPVVQYPADGFEKDTPKKTIILVQAEDLTCSMCGEKITGKYLKIDGKFYHTRCFTCSKCNRVIDTAYKIDNGRFFHADCYKELKGLICDHCGQLLDEKWKVFNGKKFHPECFKKSIQPKCAICGLSIVGDYTEDSEGIYHIACYKNKKLPRCDVCQAPIEGKYIEDLWGNISHEYHDGKSYNLCSSCSVIISKRTSKGGYEYSDGRLICGVCRESAVFHMTVVDQLIKSIKMLLKTTGMDSLPEKINVSLVDFDTMKKKSGSDNKNTKGFTKSSVMSIRSLNISSKHDIFILYGLPELEFKGVLAHELMHVWLNDQGISLTQRETEGFCNLGSMLVYQNDQSKLASILLENLARDPDPAYGDGYRWMLNKLEQKGWGDLLNDLKDK